MDSGKTINSSAPLIDMNEKAINRLFSERKKSIIEGTLRDTTKMVDKNSLNYFKVLKKTIPKASYDITSTGFGLNIHSLDYYISEQFQYFVISDSMKKARTNSFFTAQYPEIAAFYQSLDQDPRIKCIQAITPTPSNRGNTFFIYEIRS